MNKPLSSKSEVLDAARSVLLKEGERGLSLRSIAKKAGISLGAVYHYYGSKEEIVGALMEDFWKGVFLKGLCMDELSNGSSSAALRKANSLLVDNYAAFSKLFALSVRLEAPKRMFLSPYISHFVEELSSLLKKEDPEGIIFHPPMDYLSYARFLFTSLIDGVLRGKDGNDTLLVLHERLMKGNSI